MILFSGFALEEEVVPLGGVGVKVRRGRGRKMLFKGSWPKLTRPKDRERERKESKGKVKLHLYLIISSCILLSPNKRN